MTINESRDFDTRNVVAKSLKIREDAIVNGDGVVCGDLIIKGTITGNATTSAPIIGNGKLEVLDAVVNGNIFSSDVEFIDSVLVASNTTQILEVDFSGADKLSLSGGFFTIDTPGEILGSTQNYYVSYTNGGPPGLSPPGYETVVVDMSSISPTGNTIAIALATFSELDDIIDSGLNLTLIGDVLTIENELPGSVPESNDDNVNGVTITTLQQGTDLSSGNVTIQIPPIDGPFDTNTVEVMTAPCFGNISAVNVSSGEITYTTSGSEPGLDAFVYKIQDNCGLERKITQFICRSGNSNNGMLFFNNQCIIRTSQTSTPFSFIGIQLSVLEGGSPIDWSTLSILSMESFTDDSTEPDFACGDTFVYGTNSASDITGGTFSQTAGIDYPPGVTEVDLTYQKSPFTDVNVEFQNNSDGTVDIVCTGNPSVTTWPEAHFAIKVVLTVQDTAGNTSNEACFQFIINYDSD